MPTPTPIVSTKEEPLRRFYPTQGESPRQTPPMTVTAQPPKLPVSSPKKRGDAAYLAHRHPILLQRLYTAADSFLDTYTKQSFLYDAYPDYLSLQFMRDRLLREYQGLTEDFLQEGCPITWLNLLTDLVISELLCRKRGSYLRPSGDANTTSVQFSARS